MLLTTNKVSTPNKKNAELPYAEIPDALSRWSNRIHPNFGAGTDLIADA